MGKKTSIIWKIEKEDLQKLFDKSNSLSDVIRSLGLNPSNGNYRTLYKRIEFDQLNKNTLLKNKKHKKSSLMELSIEETFIENSTVAQTTLRKKILKYNLIEYKCVECDNVGEWNSKKLVLQLDHINGINNDNRLENLRYLCPNCHTQTETFTGKNSKWNVEESNIKINTCKDCDVIIHKSSTRCRKCVSRAYNIPKRKFEVNKEELENLIKNNSLLQVGRMFNVSDNTIRKRCKLLNINFKK